MRNTHFLSPLAVIAVVILFSCDESTRVLPSSMGGVDEVVFVEDPRFARDTIYKLVDSKLSADYGSFVQPQTIFSVINKDASDLDDHWVRHRNLIFVGVLDQENDYNSYIKQLIGEEGVQKVNDKGFLRAMRKQVWASGQTIHIIAAKDQPAMLANLNKSMDGLVDAVLVSEFEKIRAFVYASGINLDLTRELEKEHGITMRIPATYKKHSKSNGNFSWFRRSTIDLTGTIMLLEQPYTRALQVSPDYSIFLRDSLGKRYERSQIEGAYMTTEKRIRPDVDTVEINGNFAIRTQGMWRLVGDFMGGPFVNYLVYDEKGQRVIYLDAYVYAPDIPSKRKLIRELESILTTIDFEDEEATALK